MKKILLAAGATLGLAACSAGTLDTARNAQPYAAQPVNVAHSAKTSRPAAGDGDQYAQSLDGETSVLSRAGSATE